MIFSVEQFNGKPVYTVEEHHHVLLPWARERRRLKTPPVVLTLDHHTDTLTAFSHDLGTAAAQSGQAAQTGFTDEVALTAALERLRHDEHLDFAIKAGIIEHSILFSHVNYAENINPAIQIVNFGNYPEYPQEETEKAALRAYYEAALEDRYLERCLAEVPFDLFAVPFILDIDLDYFKTIRSIEPEHPELFYRLVRHCCAITVSRERDWVRLLNQDWEKADSTFFEARLKELLRQAVI